MSIWRYYTGLSFATRVLIWMVLGAVLGLIFKENVLFLKPVGEIFLNLLIMGAIPLVFFNLLSGLGAIENVKDFGTSGIKIIIYYLFSTALAITVGLTMTGITKAGEGMNLKSVPTADVGQIPDVWSIIKDMVPSNIFQSFSEANLIQIVLFAVLLGIVGLNLPADKKSKFQGGADFMADLMRRLVELILKASPVGLGALMAATFAEYGSQIVGSLSLFILTIYLGLSIMVIFYMTILRIIGRVYPFWFLKTTSELYATTVATCSSLASLAVSLDIAEKKLRLPKNIFSFTLPIGAQFNKDGTAIMLGTILLFTAQASGIRFSFPEMVQIVLVGLLISEGSAGIPGGGFVAAMLFAKAFNLPLEIVAIIGGSYRLIDMGNTTINCMGDLVATTIVSKLDYKWDPKESENMALDETS